MKAFFQKQANKTTTTKHLSDFWGRKTSLFYIPSNCVVPTLWREILLRSSAHTWCNLKRSSVAPLQAMG